MCLMEISFETKSNVPNNFEYFINLIFGIESLDVKLLQRIKLRFICFLFSFSFSLFSFLFFSFLFLLFLQKNKIKSNKIKKDFLGLKQINFNKKIKHQKY